MQHISFQSALAQQIIGTIDALRKEGTVAMSEANLRQVTRPTVSNVTGPFPSVWSYPLVFSAALQSLPSRYRSFIIKGRDER